MHQRTALLTAVLVLAAAGGPVVGLASADVTLTVTVETAAGAPVADADLTATVDGEVVAEATTASNGKAFMDVPDGADVTIEVDHSEYVRNSPVTVTNAGNEDVTVTVWQKASAEVTVRDADGPVEGVRVVFWKRGEIVTVRSTDAQGTVASGIVESGQYTLRLFEPEYFSKSVQVNIDERDTVAEVTIERGSVPLEVRVLDDHFDPPKPIAEATISGETIGSVPTLADGTREFSVPVNSEVTVTVEKPGYDTIRRTIDIEESGERINITTRREPAVNLELSNQRVVVGETVQLTVTDEYGEPLPEATVVLDGETVGTPDASGTLRVTIDTAGNHTVVAELDQLISERRTVVGVEPGADGSTATAGGPDTVAGGSDGGDGGGESLTIGDLNLRSTAIGVAGGLVLAAVLFVFLRFR